MVNFFRIFLFTFLQQLLVLLLFCLLIAIGSSNIGLIFVLLLTYLILYFVNSKEICNRMNLKSNSLSLYYGGSWFINIFCILAIVSLFWEVLPKESGFFSGLEYLIIPMFSGLYLFLWWIIRFFIFICNGFTKK